LRCGGGGFELQSAVVDVDDDDNDNLPISMTVAVDAVDAIEKAVVDGSSKIDSDVTKTRRRTTARGAENIVPVLSFDQSLSKDIIYAFVVVVIVKQSCLLVVLAVKRCCTDPLEHRTTRGVIRDGVEQRSRRKR
jgi:hypothetical protein